MPRQTSLEINAEIVDRAASLFAQHGFGHTSLQQVADAVGYTKAGLLHHFPSKQAIFDAVVVAVVQQLSELAAAAATVQSGRERDLAVITSMVDLTIAWPGVSAFANSLVHQGPELDAELQTGGLALLEAFAFDFDELDHDRLIRIVSACAGLTMATLQAATVDLVPDWRDLIIGAAMDTLGHSRIYPS